MKNNRADCSKGQLTPAKKAAYDFVDDMIANGQIDQHDTSGSPMWYGWALREGFLAGVAWARTRKAR